MTAEDGKKYEVEVIREVKEKWKPEIGKRYEYIYLDTTNRVENSRWDAHPVDHLRSRLGLFEPDTGDAQLHFQYLEAITEATKWLPKAGDKTWYYFNSEGNIDFGNGAYAHKVFRFCFPTKEKAKKFAELALRHAEMMEKYG